PLYPNTILYPYTTLFRSGMIGGLLLNGQIGAERDLLNWVNDFIVPFPFYNQYIGFHPVLKLLCMILVAVFIGGYYYLSYLVIGKKYAIYDKEGRIRLTTMKYNSSSKLRSYFKKEYQTFFRNPVYVIKDRKSTRLNSSHVSISYALICLKKKKNNN